MATNYYTNAQIKVAAYIRVSTDILDQENSFETQERYFNQLLSHNPDWVSAGIYSDYGISGTSKEKRVGFNRILRHCKEGKINRIVCKSVSRFSRNTADFLSALRVLQECQVTILFEKEAIDTASKTNDFILTTLGAIAQEESRSISGNINWANRKRFPKGEVPNQEIYGYRFNDNVITTDSGYRYKDVDIVEEEAKVISRIYTEAVQGIPYAEIARELNYEGIRHPESEYTRKRKEHSEKGQLKSDIDEGWTAKHIYRILTKERYVGDVRIQKTYTVDYLTHKFCANKGEVEQYLVHNHHLAIVSRQLYEEVQKVVAANAIRYGESRRKTSHAFSKLLICGECGRYYSVRTYNDRTYWYCQSVNKNDINPICHAKKIDEGQLMAMLREAISKRFNHTIAQIQARLEYTQHMEHMERDCVSYRRQINAVRLTIENTRKHTNPQMISATLDEENRRLADAQEEEKSLIEQLEHLEKYRKELEKTHECREKAIEWIKTLPTGDEGTQELFRGMMNEHIKAFVLAITIQSPSQFTIHWFDDVQTHEEIDEQ